MATEQMLVPDEQASPYSRHCSTIAQSVGRSDCTLYKHTPNKIVDSIGPYTLKDRTLNRKI